MCLYPKLIKNRRYTANKKNGGIIPPLPMVEFNGKMIVDERVLEVPVGCGKCMECRKQKGREWSVRLQEEIRHEKNGIFVTLTFSNESIKELGDLTKAKGYERDNEIATIATRRFLERWRKKHKKSVRHWLVTELGHKGTENVHMHGIIWTDEDPKEITERWGYGYTWLSTDNGGYVNNETINYIVKYITKQDEKHTYYKPKVLTSAGIGKKYMERHDAERNKYVKGMTKEEYTTRQGIKLAMPIYYRNKIYTDEEKEKLWIEKLDKEERWVNGQKIDISVSEEKYYKALKMARIKNAELKYGNDEIDWDKRRYENERRNINYMKRRHGVQRSLPSAGAKKVEQLIQPIFSKKKK